MTKPEYDADLVDHDPDESKEWKEALVGVIDGDGPERARFILRELFAVASARGAAPRPLVRTPYVNTIAPSDEPPFPGDLGMEKRIRRIVRWNAMAMVARANQRFAGIGGHVATYASSASLYEVGFNHFFRGKDAPGGGDQVFFQGHASPGIYAHAFLAGRLTEIELDHFRRETNGRGLSSYPHPWLMPDFWEFPTVSMGLGPMAAVYQARFNKYLAARGHKDTSDNHVWCFLGDGECDEPEVAGALGIAAREQVDNLIFVVNCNLQRLDGPVRGNGKIIQELEGLFRGAGWEVIKVIWGKDWDPLLARDRDGLLVARMNEVVDGQFQKYSVESGAYIRQDFFGTDPRLLALVGDYTDEQLKRLRRGGHSYEKLYAAYHQAREVHHRRPVVILAHTVKGWSLGEGFEAANVAHQQKKLDHGHLRRFRDLLELPISDEILDEIPYYHPGAESPEVLYLRARRAALGGELPLRRRHAVDVPPVPPALFAEHYEGSKDGLVASTTVAFVRLLRKLLRDGGLGRRVVPIIPDEARTFGMDPLFREVGIYAPQGQLYKPVDARMLLSYHESKDGQLLEEGITEAGAMASFIAAATSYSTHGRTMIPFYIFYSMFGLQRTGDQLWAAGDARARGFLLGATAGRTTLNGEGLQHEDGQSQLYALAYPALRAYDPAYAYEVAVLVREGMTRMFEHDEDVVYYLTLYNENYAMPPMPAGVEDGIIKGLYLLRPSPVPTQPPVRSAPPTPTPTPTPTAAAAIAEATQRAPRHVQLFGSGALLPSVLEAQQLLAERFAVAADVWSVTSYQQLYRQARAVERAARLHPRATVEPSYLVQQLTGHAGPVIAVSDWTSELPSILGRFLPRRLYPLGTDGYGRSDTRAALRRHFEVDAPLIAATALYALAAEGALEPSEVEVALRTLDIDPEKVDPAGA